MYLIFFASLLVQKFCFCIRFPFSLNHLILANYYLVIYQLIGRLICLIFYSPIGDWKFLCQFLFSLQLIRVCEISCKLFLLRINSLQQVLGFLLLIFDLTLFFFYSLIKIVNLNSLFGFFD